MTEYTKKQITRTNNAISSIFFLMGLLFSCIASRVPDFKAILNINDAELGMLLFNIPFGQLCTMPISAYLITKYSSKTVLRYSAVIFPLVLALTTFTTNYFHLLLIFFFYGVFANLISISMNTQASRAEINFKQNLMPKFHGLWSLAMAIGGAFGIILIKLNLSMALHYYIVIIFFICLGSYVNKFLFTLDKDENNMEQENNEFKLTYFLLFCGIVGFSAALLEGVMLNWSSLYFKDVVLVSNDYVGVGYLACITAMVIGRFSAVYFIEKVGKPLVILICGCLVVVGISIPSIFPYFIPSTLGLFILGLGTSAVVPMVYSYAGRANPKNSSKAITVVVSITFTGFMVGQPLIGFLSYLFSLRIAFMVFIIVGCFIAIASYYFMRFEKKTIS